MRIAVDIDDVIYPWSQYAHEACLAAGITNGKEITQWGFHADYGVTPEELWDVLLAAYRQGMLRQPMYEGVNENLALLKEVGHTIHLVTARGFEFQGGSTGIGAMVRRDTIDMVWENRVPHDSLTFVKDKSLLRCDIAIDDSAANCRAMVSGSKGETLAFLRSTIHNANDDWGWRADDLTDFTEMVLAGTARARRTPALVGAPVHALVHPFVD